MQTSALLNIIRCILAQPTAPFHEDAVRTEIIIQLAECPHVMVEQDDFGNVIARYQRGTVEPRFAFAAHMDHPGYVFDLAAGDAVRDGEPGDRKASDSSMDVPDAHASVGPISSTFLGGVPREYREKNPPTRDFCAFSMWDLPACEVRDGRIYSRACDDLIGCASILALFHELERQSAETSVYGLFTRAEEVGFLGAIRLAQSGRLPRTVTIVSLETSSERGGAAKMGEGVVIRVGDRTSIFDSNATAMFSEFAKLGKIPVQRCLMSGGTCEATAYQLYGYRCAALCIALGNYHNCGPEYTIASEYVAIVDVSAMVRLMILAAIAPEPPDPQAALREKLEKSAGAYARFLA